MAHLGRCIVASLACLIFSASFAYAQYPDRPIKLIRQFSAGEGDIVSRLFSQPMSVDLGQPIVVESRPGAGGSIATGVVAKSPADGYTLLWTLGLVSAVSPALYKDLPFDPDKDFTPVAVTAESQYMLVVNKDVPVSNARELVEYAKKNPGKLTFSSGGVGSPLHMAAELFMAQTGVKFLHVPYKGGVEAALAVATGDVDMVFGALSGSLPHIQSGRVKALGSTGHTRYPNMPNVPTIHESVPNYQMVDWHGILAPAATPKPIIDKLRASVGKSLASPEVQARFKELGLGTPPALSSDEVAQRMKSERALWAKIIKDSGITAQ